ncbi:MAG: sulfotransferase [Gammaproteobacteria bacterium]
MNAPARSVHQEVLRLMRAKDWQAAEQATSRLNEQFPEFAAGWYAASQIAFALGRTGDALDRIDRAVAIEPNNPRGLMQRAHCLLALRRRSEACDAAALAQHHSASAATLLDAIGGFFSIANDQPRALAAFDQAVALAPDNAHFLFNRAAARRFLGRLTEAEGDFDRVIAMQPADYEAYKARADLRTQTNDLNHVAELEALVDRPPADWRAEVQLRYALAKEYEDLCQYEKSFRHLKLGAARRREFLRYDVAADVATADWIIEAFPREPRSTAAAASQEAPIFIVGLPRSGTTLVDRVLDSHSALHSAGELNDFALCVVDAVHRVAGNTQSSRQQLIMRSADVDFAALGQDYLSRAQSGALFGKRFIDKMPLNYLYCGLIRRALPNARIVHLTRHPLAVCYAMYKTLFKDGYPFSYDLTEIGDYYIAYRRLMDHWIRTMPAAIHQISYENLVQDQIGETRKLLEYCALPWEDACVEFHRNPTATTTASAAQVRREIYNTSIDQWRHFDDKLGALRDQLEAAGVNVNPC